MINVILKELQLDQGVADRNSIGVLRGVDKRKLTTQNVHVLLQELHADSDFGSIPHINEIFYRYLFLAYLFHDVEFGPFDWGVDMRSQCPVVYVPKYPFAPKSRHLQYTYDTMDCTSDNMIIIVRDKDYINIALDILCAIYDSNIFDWSLYTSSRIDTSLPEVSKNIEVIRDNAYNTYISLLSYFDNDDFKEWCSSKLESTAYSHVIKELSSIGTAKEPYHNTRLLNLFEEYISEQDA